MHNMNETIAALRVLFFRASKQWIQALITPG